MQYRLHIGIAQRALKKNDFDFLIASSAIAHEAILISNDKIFGIIQDIEPSLAHENWLA
jgi:predicted nucleic acid-binding protein